MDKVSQILAETARDLTLAHVAGKPLDRVIAEGSARIAAHYAQPRICKGDCGEELTDTRFEYCSRCDREIRGPFSFD